MADGIETVDRATWIPGDLRAAPTALLVLAAVTLTPGEQECYGVQATARPLGGA